MKPDHGVDHTSFICDPPLEACGRLLCKESYSPGDGSPFSLRLMPFLASLSKSLLRSLPLDATPSHHVFKVPFGSYYIQ